MGESMIDPDQLDDSGLELVAVLPGEFADVDDDPRLAVGHLEGGVPYFPGLLSEDGAKEPLLR